MISHTITEVDTGVFCVRGARRNTFAQCDDVNWVLLREGSDITLIDSGYPADIGSVEESLRDIGANPRDVQAIVLTHAHIDHIGSVNRFYVRYGTPVYMDHAETRVARRESVEQPGLAAVAINAWRPRMLPWALGKTSAGGLQKIVIAHARPFPGSGALDLPGRPVPVSTRGHTSGHCSYYLPTAGAVVTGDSLITGHPTSNIVGPQLLSPLFDHSRADALAALDQLEQIDAEIVIPGHGSPYRGPVKEAAKLARERATFPSSSGTSTG